MGFQLRQLWSAPEVNPYNKKARSIPVINPFNKYGRVFFFSYFGFFIAFWSWLAFPPLLSITIKNDLHLSQNEVANSNIISLTATLLVRIIAGPTCDRYGPRLTFAALLLLGAIPTLLAGTATNAMGLYFIRFFVGILGGSFVPCQVWINGFFDKNVIGTASALVGGWGNAGSGITYFVMPAVYNSLKIEHGLSSHIAWRVSFVVPFITITVTAISLVLLTDDTPTGEWSKRGIAVAPERDNSSVLAKAGGPVEKSPTTDSCVLSSNEKNECYEAANIKPATGVAQMLDEIQHEVVIKPTFKETIKVIISPQTVVVCATYFCSFGGEIAIASTLGSFYLKNFPTLGQTKSGQWAAMYGLLNFVTRPLGGFMGDLIYKYTNGSLWAKKVWVHFLCVMSGTFMVVIGQLNPHKLETMIGLIALAAIFMQAANGANFALVPHIHPRANGVLAGIVGAMGNFGGIVFAVIFRYNPGNYARVFWIMGTITIVLNVCLAWVRPIPKGQIGGR